MRTTPNRLDKIIIWLLTSVRRIRFIIERASIEAYDQGYHHGLTAGASIAKKSPRKIKQELNKLYKKRYSA